MDLVVPHPRVLTRDPENERLDIIVEPGSSAPVVLPKRPFAADEVSMPFQHRVRLNEQNRFAQRLMKPLGLHLQTSGEGDKYQLFGTRQSRLGLGFTFEHPELLPKKGNLEIFFVRGYSAGDSHIDDQREKAQQQVIEHRLRSNPRFRKDQFPAYHFFALNLVAESAMSCVR